MLVAGTYERFLFGYQLQLGDKKQVTVAVSDIAEFSAELSRLAALSEILPSQVRAG